MYYGFYTCGRERAETTGQRIKRYCLEHSLSMMGLAEKADKIGRPIGVRVRPGDIYNYVAEKCQPKRDKLYVLARAMEADEEWLVGYNKGYNVP